jgi:hypothetical protein
MLADLQLHELLDRSFRFVEAPEQHLRVSLWEEPIHDHIYALGFDAAYGILGRDSDAACVLDKSVFPHRQVCEIQGWLGERFFPVVYAAARFFNNAFIVGERQVGLVTLRRLYDVPPRGLGYRWMYYDKDETKRSRPVGDKLGHHRTHDDITMRNLRLAVQAKSLELRSELLIEQMSKLQFRDTLRDQDERNEDEKLKVKLAGGGSPDLVMALCYSYHGIKECGKFDMGTQGAKYAPDTLGALFNHEEFEQGIEAGQETSWV